MDTRALGHLYTDCLVIGTGVAGMRVALEAARGGKVILLAKDDLLDSNTYFAQGGIAAVLEQSDSIEQHIQDTLQIGGELCDREIVKMVISRGPEQIDQLQCWSTPLDMSDDGQIVAGKEGGHSRARIAHALGDATGKAIVHAMAEPIRKDPNIKLFEHCFCIDLLTDHGCCCGVICYHPRHGLQCFWARQIVLASGGAGRLYRETTNPVGATADGLAMAYRAGAVLRDVEFFQFHPTTLYIAGATRALITEAIRGEGGVLIDRTGKRFMTDYHEMADLAPRDVVSRAIYEQMAKTRSTHVFLDVRHLGKEFIARRFPNIYDLCQAFGIDVESDPIAVRPSGHYMIGGVKTDLNGRTNIENLYCCGEAASTGLHGSNRLGSNSLLEGMVFGQICGQNIAEYLENTPNEIQRQNIISDIPRSGRTELDIADVTSSLRSIMTRNVGVQRRADRLGETIEIIDFWQRYVMDKVFNDPDGWQCQNMLTVSRLIAQSALERKESRGVHYRTDFVERDDVHFRRHIEIGPFEAAPTL